MHAVHTHMWINVNALTDNISFNPFPVLKVSDLSDLEEGTSMESTESTRILFARGGVGEEVHNNCSLGFGLSAIRDEIEDVLLSIEA